MDRNAAVLAEQVASFPASPPHLEDLHAALDRFWAHAKRALPRPPGNEWQIAFTTAVVEIATNVMRHAYAAEAHPRPMELRLRAYSDALEAEFLDQGEPYVPKQLPPQAAEDPLGLTEGGYGIALVRAAVDKLEYARTPDAINHWRLVKRL
jgi:anti-sigma regulatory factor (Ser/Thr protein kinase)